MSNISLLISGEQIHYLMNYLPVIDLLGTDKSRCFAQPRLIIVLTFGHRSFDQLNVSNHSLPARGTDPPFSHKSVLSITHEQNIILQLNTYLLAVICRSRGELSADEKEGKNTSNDNNHYCVYFFRQPVENRSRIHVATFITARIIFSPSLPALGKIYTTHTPLNTRAYQKQNHGIK